MIVRTVFRVEFTMKSLLLGAFLCAASILALLTGASAAEDDLSGFTLNQLNTTIRNSGAAKQRIFSILTFDSEDCYESSIAILRGSGTGWRITVLHRVNGGLNVEWRSANLSDDFSNSPSNNFKIENVDDEQIVEFSGCAQHQRGGREGVLGALLYSPRSKQAFFGTIDSMNASPTAVSGLLTFQRTPTNPVMNDTCWHLRTP